LLELIFLIGVKPGLSQPRYRHSLTIHRIAANPLVRLQMTLILAVNGEANLFSGRIRNHPAAFARPSHHLRMMNVRLTVYLCIGLAICASGCAEGLHFRSNRLFGFTGESHFFSSSRATSTKPV